MNISRVLYIVRRLCSEIKSVNISSSLITPANVALHGEQTISKPHDLKIAEEESELSLLRRLRDTKPALPVHSFTLAPFVNTSETLKSLLALGVDLNRIEKLPKVAELLLKKDFRKDIDPYLLFFRTHGVSDDRLGQVINRFPLILAEEIDILSTRLSFLQSYGFSQSNISRILTSVPRVLGLSVEDVDKKLNFVTDQFALTPVQTTMVITKCPRLLVFDDDKIKFNKLSLKDIGGFSETELSTMVLTSPKIFTGGRQQLMAVFDYMHHVMDIKHSQIVQFPQIFRTRLRRIEQRHQFLVSLGQNQYNPKLPNFVSLYSLVSGDDKEFAENVAKSSIDQFNLFLKTL